MFELNVEHFPTVIAVHLADMTWYKPATPATSVGDILQFVSGIEKGKVEPRAYLYGAGVAQKLGKFVQGIYVC
jgi:hypothetical protein